MGMYKELGARLRARRNKLAMTQAALAQAAGCGKRTVEMIEAGLTDPSLSTLAALCDALKCKEMDLLGPRGKG